ncbi:TPA: hypothetical protein J8S23_002763 [Enterococcus faecium]|nr:hypothetical protein [Enterococcus faecium]HBA0767956.1 hypothetical protein [Enterococcus faecium]
MVTERGIVDYFLSLDEGLRRHYNVYQTTVFAINYRNRNCFSPSSMKSNGSFQLR